MAARPYQKHSLVINQNGESQNECFKQTKHAEFSKKRTLCVSGCKKCLFFGKFVVLCFLETPVMRFILWPYYRRIVENTNVSFQKSSCQGCFIWQHLVRVLVLLFISFCKWLFFDFLSTINDWKEIV